MVIAILNNISKSLNVELGKFFQRLGQVCIGSKQAFSKSRYKLKPEAFIDLNDTLLGAYYGQEGFKLYAGKYLLLASDGSDYELPWEESLKEEFGVADNGQAKQPMCMAKGVKIWDVLNCLTISAVLGRYDMAEIMHFKKAWQKARTLLAKADTKVGLILLGDMHYPSFWLMYQIQAEGNDFLFRSPVGFCREIVEFMQGGKKEERIYIPIAEEKGGRKYSYMERAACTLQEVPQGLWVRALNFTRPTGERSCLITSVSAEALDYDAICQLYPYRWGEEVSFNFDKNRTEIENFSAKKPQGIYQDWYANLLASNIAQLLIEDAQELLDEEQASTGNKYRYRINRSVAYGTIKDELPALLFGEERIGQFYDRMVKIILRNRVPVRPGRSRPREKKHKLRFSMNYRRIL
jgi:hypothetical protein